MKTAIIDYGSGNLRSAQKSFQRASGELGSGGDIFLTNDPQDVRSADRIVLPGVGAFRDCRNGLAAIPDMWETLQDEVKNKAKPFLGICVGMQLMADHGLEGSKTDGFGWIAADVSKITPRDKTLKIPHMGWNTINTVDKHPLFDGIKTGDEGLHAYFVHSFHVRPKNKKEKLATTNYGGEVTAVIGKDNMVGTQFHPEKSQKLGLALIKNFLNWKP